MYLIASEFNQFVYVKCQFEYKSKYSNNLRGKPWKCQESDFNFLKTLT